MTSVHMVNLASHAEVSKVGRVHDLYWLRVILIAHVQDLAEYLLYSSLQYSIVWNNAKFWVRYMYICAYCFVFSSFCRKTIFLPTYVLLLETYTNIYIYIYIHYMCLCVCLTRRSDGDNAVDRPTCVKRKKIKVRWNAQNWLSMAFLTVTSLWYCASLHQMSGQYWKSLQLQH